MLYYLDKYICKNIDIYLIIWNCFCFVVIDYIYIYIKYEIILLFYFLKVLFNI